MTENDHPPEETDGPPSEGDGSGPRFEGHANGPHFESGGTPPAPPRKRRHRGVTVLVAAIVAGAAIPAIVFGVTHAAATPASAANSPSLSATQPASTRPLTTKELAARMDPGLVDINVTFGLAKARGAATGMVLTPSGEVLTNNHVVEGATAISVTDIGNGKTYSATVVGYDRSADVAVLQLQGASGLRTVPLGNSSTVSVGTRVTALGNAGGVGGTPRVARGKVVALDQSITASDAGGVNAEQLTGLIETNAGIRPGDSGGPLVTSTGQVIGMDAAASASFTSRPSSTQGYTIPINEALAISRQVEAHQASSTVHIGPTGFLGVEIIPPSHLGPGFGGRVSGQTSDAVVGGVLPGYPAQHAGLSQGDVITAVDGQAVTSPNGLTALLSTHHPGDTVQLQWTTPAGQKHTANITLASGPPA
jgi:S1-C subfamily serine protease